MNFILYVQWTSWATLDYDSSFNIWFKVRESCLRHDDYGVKVNTFGEDSRKIKASYWPPIVEFHENTEQNHEKTQQPW